MSNDVAYTKKLCMTEFEIHYSAFKSSNFFDAGSGQINSSFIYIEKGSATVNSVKLHLELRTGDLLYIPEGVRYKLLWSGSPDIEFYNMQIISKHYENIMTTDTFALQHIPEMSNESTGKIIHNIFDLMSTDERINKIRAISLYYGFYADVLPYMRVEAPVKYSTALLSAIEYIEKNCASDISASQIAVACFVSESRLYHIFNTELNTTPITYRNEIRVEKAAQYLRSQTVSCDDVSSLVGFNTTAHFRETFKAYTGLTPSEYRRIANKSRSK